MADRPTFAVLADLVKKIGYTPTGDEATRATDCLVEASELIRDAADKTWLSVDELTLDPALPPTVKRVCIASAFRGFDNARALQQKTLGDSSQMWDRSGVDGGEAVYLTDDERRRVVKAAEGSSMAVGTLVSPFSGDTVSTFYGSLDTV